MHYDVLIVCVGYAGTQAVIPLRQNKLDGTIAIVGDTRFGWTPHDIIAAPGWATVMHHAGGEAIPFGASDRATQEKLGLWRGDRRPAMEGGS